MNPIDTLRRDVRETEGFCALNGAEYAYGFLKQRVEEYLTKMALAEQIETTSPADCESGGEKGADG